MQRYKRKFIENDSSISIGDEILFGKFKNKSAVITGFGIDTNNQPTIKTDRGEMPLYHFRIKKLMGIK
jgi:hypothetical protein